MKFRFKPQLSLQTYTIITAVVASIGLLSFRLVSLVPDLSRVEHWLPPLRDTLSTIWNTPLELPILISRFLVAAVSPVTGVGLSRLPSVLLGLVLLGAAYWLLRRWYGYRLAMFGTILLASSTWFLHASRLAANDIVYPLSMTLILALMALWHQPRWSKKLRYLSAIVISGLLYVPGMVWLLLGVAFFERKTIAANLKVAKLHTSLALSLSFILLVPLAHYILLDWQNYRAILGIGQELPTIMGFLQEFAKTWQYIFIGGFEDVSRNLGGLPILDVFMTLTFVVGLYMYSKHLKAVRTKQLIWLWLVGTALIALQGWVAVSLILPIVLVLSIGGIGYLLHLWLKVFPRNPYARVFGIGLLGLVIGFSVAYNLRNYFVAWPNNTETRSEFTLQR